jgi:RimJ/RimL family protein N-acetyltransferase
MQRVKKFRAKIGVANEPSIALFKKLGFTETGRSEIFKEVILELEEPQGEEYEKTAWTRITAGASNLQKALYD